jgi:hypothetical protein
MNDAVNASDYDIDDGTMGDAPDTGDEYVGTEEDNTIIGDDDAIDDNDDPKPSDYLDPEGDDPEHGSDGTPGAADGKNGEDGDAANIIEEDDADFDDDFVKRALAVGVSESNLKALGDDAMSIVERLENASTRPASEPQRDEQGRFKSADDTPGDDEDPLAGLNTDEYDPNIVKAIQHVSNRNQELSQQLEQVLAQSRAAEQERILTDLDQFVDGLGSEWRDVFGSGNTRSLNPKSLAVKNRQSLLEEMDAIAEGYAKRGKQIPSESELRDKALRSAFGKDFEKRSQRKLSSESQKQKLTRVTRPPQSQRTSGKTGVSRAVGTVQALLNEGIA